MIKIGIYGDNGHQITAEIQKNPEINAVIVAEACCKNEGKTGGIASGIGNIGKSIVSAVNTNNMIIDRAQINFGASDNAFYAPNQVIVRQTKHDPILGSSDETTF